MRVLVAGAERRPPAVALQDVAEVARGRFDFSIAAK